MQGGGPDAGQVNIKLANDELSCLPLAKITINSPPRPHDLISSKAPLQSPSSQLASRFSRGTKRDLQKRTIDESCATRTTSVRNRIVPSCFHCRNLRRVFSTRDMRRLGGAALSIRTRDGLLRSRYVLYGSIARLEDSDVFR